MIAIASAKEGWRTRSLLPAAKISAYASLVEVRVRLLMNCTKLVVRISHPTADLRVLWPLAEQARLRQPARGNAEQVCGLRSTQQSIDRVRFALNVHVHVLDWTTMDRKCALTRSAKLALVTAKY
jgi:hypothetical protein